MRFRSKAKLTHDHINRLRTCNKKVAMSLPTGFDLNIATWNVEGLREISKYDQILSLSQRKNIHLLAVQETKSDSVHIFQKNGWEILHSGSSDSKHYGVGFFVSSSLRPHVKHFLAHSPRICEITISTNPHPVTVFSIQAPSQVEDPDEDQARKEAFWAHLDTIFPIINTPLMF